MTNTIFNHESPNNLSYSQTVEKKLELEFGSLIVNDGLNVERKISLLQESEITANQSNDQQLKRKSSKNSKIHPGLKIQQAKTDKMKRHLFYKDKARKEEKLGLCRS